MHHYIGALNARMGTQVSGITATCVGSGDAVRLARQRARAEERTGSGDRGSSVRHHHSRSAAILLAGASEATASTAGSTPDSTERERVLSALFETNWNKCKAAKQLHWSRMTLYRKMAKYHIIPA